MTSDSLARRAVDWTFTIPFLVVFGLVLGLFDPLQRIARVFGPRPHEIVVGLLQRSLIGAFRICGARLEVDRSGAVEPWTPYLVISNHQSMFDVPIFGALLFSNFPKYVAKRELARWIPSISYNLRRGGNAIIDRRDRDQAVAAIRTLAAEVERRKVSAVIFPEGTRARHGDIGPFKARGTLELLRAAPNTAILPVTIDGSWRLLRHNLMPVPFGVRVRVSIAAPIDRRPDEDPESLMRRAERQIREVLDAWRVESARSEGADRRTEDLVTRPQRPKHSQT
jgi:1-acyl-sn-glycerol-3-phosphate acyltransferase